MKKKIKVFLKITFLHVSCDFNHFEQKKLSFQIFQVSNRRKLPSYFASEFPIGGNRLSYFAYGFHDMRSCYRFTASETVTTNRVAVTDIAVRLATVVRKFSKRKKFQSLKKTIFLHVSCDFNHFEQKTFFSNFTNFQSRKIPFRTLLPNF